MVFDGDYLPSKAATEVERETRREEHKRVGLDMYRNGKVAAAHKELQKAVDVTPVMARELIEELKRMNVRYIVAPYEADAQLAYLERKGIISAVLSEDSDLLVFGTRCLLTKLDQYGDCVEINRQDFTACREINLVGWSDAEFRRMAILSGCDYLRGIPKMGLMKAYRLVRKYKNVEKIIRMVHFDGQFCVPSGYQDAFTRADLTFLHQRIFCPLENRLKMLSDFDDKQPGPLDYIGKDIDQDTAMRVAHGDLHPMTKKPIIIRKSNAISPRTPYSIKYSNGGRVEAEKGQTIESFFKARRTPLAELDPNCFTPSPTQLRVQQEQANATWQSNPVPTSRETTRLMHSVSLPSTSDGSRGYSLENALLPRRASTMPQKRRRLCDQGSDGVDGPLPSKLAGTRSKFFESTALTDSPIVEASRRRRQQRARPMNIWSDDSIEDAMANLPDVGRNAFGNEKRKIPVFQESNDQVEPPKNPTTHPIPQPAEDAVDHIPEISQCSDSSKASNTTRASMSTIATNTTADSVSSMLDASIKSDLTALTRSFMFQPVSSATSSENKWSLAPRQETERNNPTLDRKDAGLLVAPKATTQKLDRAGLKLTQAKHEMALEAPSQHGLNRSDSLTPLGRLGINAFHRARSVLGPAPSNNLNLRENTPAAPSSALNLGNNPQTPPKAMPQQDEQCAEKESESDTVPHEAVSGTGIVNEEHAPHIPRDEDAACLEDQPEARSFKVQGSEDFIVPDSEGSDTASISEEVAPGKRTIDLGRFAFDST